MAWVADSFFGNSNFNINPVVPFNTSGNQKILSLNGSGYSYRNEFAYYNVELSCKVAVKSFGVGIYNQSFLAPVLIARRQSNGDMYCAGLVFSEFSSGTRLIQIQRYDSTLNTFTSLSFDSVIGSVFPYPANDNHIFTLKFSLNGTSLSATLYKSNGDILIQTSVINSVINSQGHVGIGANLINDLTHNFWLADDFTITPL
jgi:hypothetical protein